MIKSSAIRFALIISFSLAFSYFNNLDFVQAMEVEQSKAQIEILSHIQELNEKEEEISHQKQYEINIASISSRSIEDWASLWDDDNSSIKLKKLDFSIDSELEALRSWLFFFNYLYHFHDSSSSKYKNLLLEVRTKFESSSQDAYVKSLLEYLTSI